MACQLSSLKDPFDKIHVAELIQKKLNDSRASLSLEERIALLEGAS
jgi:hypothetical protein